MIDEAPKDVYDEHRTCGTCSMGKPRVLVVSRRHLRKDKVRGRCRRRSIRGTKKEEGSKTFRKNRNHDTKREKHTKVEDVADGCHVQTHVWVLGKPHEQNVEQMGKKGWDLSANQRFRHEKENETEPAKGGWMKRMRNHAVGNRTIPSVISKRAKSVI